MKNVLPEQALGVYLIQGCEVNILDAEGALDLPAEILDRLDLVIASMHTPTFPPADVETHTRAWLAVAKNPSVDIIGHAGDQRFLFDFVRSLGVQIRQSVEIIALVKVGGSDANAAPTRGLKRYEVRWWCPPRHFATVLSAGLGVAVGAPRVIPRSAVLSDAGAFCRWGLQKSAVPSILSGLPWPPPS
jgi:hypothetical protein